MLDFIVNTYSGGILWILLSMVIILKMKSKAEHNRSDFFIRFLNLVCVCFFMVLGITIISVKLYGTFH